MIKKIKVIGIIAVAIIGLLWLNTGINREFVEDLDIPAAFGLDIIKKNNSDVLYKISYSGYNFSENKVTSSELEASGRTIGETRQTRQVKSDKKITFGLEKLYIFHDDLMEYGINNILDVLLVNPTINDRGYVVVSKQPPMEILEFKIKGYPSSADFIEGMLKNAQNYNFYPKNYKLVDLYVRADAEGRNIVLPYIEMSDSNLEITGLALFDNDKMVKKIDIEEARILSIIKEKKSTGIITLQDDKYESVDYAATSSRKINCENKDGKYHFNIKIEFKGDIITNEMYKEIMNDEEEIKEFEEDMEEYIRKKCKEFITKVQQEYKIDCLGLGKYGAAKYGRNTGVDWNEAVSEAVIDFDIDVKLLNQGRGDY